MSNNLITSSGGIAPYSYFLESGTLPPSLSLSSSGLVYGTSSAPGTYTFTVTSVDSASFSGSRTYNLSFTRPTITLSPTLLSGGLSASVYPSQDISASGGTAPYVYSLFTSGSQILTVTDFGNTSFNRPFTASGIFNGVPYYSAQHNGQILYLHSDPDLAVYALYFTLDSGRGESIYYNSGTGFNPTGSYLITPGNGGTLPGGEITFGTLPPGLTLNSSSGLISGTPSSSGFYSVTILGTDSYNSSGSREYDIYICPILIISPAVLSLITSSIDVPFSQSFKVNTGTGPWTFSNIFGTVPPGLVLTSSGQISCSLSGTPTVSGLYSYIIQCVDSKGCTTSSSYSQLITPAPIISISNINFSQSPTYRGDFYGVFITSSGGTAPYTYSVSSMIPGFSFSYTNSTASLSGSYSGSVPFSQSLTVTSVDRYGFSGSNSTTYSFIQELITLTPNTLPGGTSGSVYTNEQLSSSGGVAPYTYSIVEPTSFTAIGFGNPPYNGVYTFQGLNNGLPYYNNGFGNLYFSSNFGNNQYVLGTGLAGFINAYLGVPNSTDPSGQYTVQAAPSPAGVVYSTADLPPGLNINNTGLISGTPIQSGSYTFTVDSQDIYGVTGSYQYTVYICPNIEISPLTSTNPTASIENSFTQSFSANAGTAPLTYSLSGSLPSGLTFNTSSGILSGIPNQTGSYSYTITVIDSGSCSATQSYSQFISAPTITLSNIPSGSRGISYSSLITSSGGGTPYTYSTLNSMPAGISLSSSGLVYGTASGVGVTTVLITSTDNDGFTGSKTYNLNFTSETLSMIPITVPGGISGSVYTTQTFIASGGFTPYLYTINSGALPTGLSLTSSNNSGSLFGTLSSTGSYTFTIQASDVYGVTTSSIYTVYICPVMTISPSSIPTGSVGVAFNQSFSNNSTATPIIFTLNSGSFPTGLTLNTGSGLLSGTPTIEGSYTFVLRATDSQGCTGTKMYTQTVYPTINLSSISSAGTSSVLYNQTITSSGGVSPYTYALMSGSLPTGIALTGSSGNIFGTYTGTASIYSFVITSTDVNSFTGSSLYNISMSVTSSNSFAIQLSGAYYTVIPDSSSYYPVGGINTNKGLTVDIWAKTTNPNVDQYYILACDNSTLYPSGSNTYNTDNGWGIIGYPLLTQSLVIWGGYNTGSTTNRQLACPAISSGSNFTHLRFCWNTSSAYLFRDGILASTASGWNTSETIQDAASDLDVLGDAQGITMNIDSDPFDTGFIPSLLATITMDEFRISNICRTTGSVLGQQYFTSSVNNVGKNFTIDANTTLYLKFNEDVGRYAKDLVNPSVSASIYSGSSPVSSFTWVPGFN